MIFWLKFGRRDVAARTKGYERFLPEGDDRPNHGIDSKVRRILSAKHKIARKLHFKLVIDCGSAFLVCSPGRDHLSSSCYLPLFLLQFSSIVILRYADSIPEADVKWLFGPCYERIMLRAAVTSTHPLYAFAVSLTFCFLLVRVRHCLLL